MLYPSSSLGEQDRLRLFQFLWNDPNLLGVIDDPTKFGEAWQSQDAIDTTSANHYYGCIRLPEGSVIGCGSYFSHYGNETWFSLFMPLELLGRVVPLEYPLALEQIWMKPLDFFLSSIGARVYQYMPFTVAVLGEDVSGASLERIQEHLSHASGPLVPEAMFRQKGIAPHGLRVGKDLWWTGGG